MKRILAIVLLLLPPFVYAKTHCPALDGACSNSWPQFGLRVTDRVFDMAIQGRGFFVLKSSESNDFIFTRHGTFTTDENGWLIEETSGAKVMGYYGKKLVPIDVGTHSRILWEPTQTLHHAISHSVELNGTVAAYFKGGLTVPVTRLALALFERPLKLKRITEHYLEANIDSGKPSIGPASTNGRGQIYGSALEELDYSQIGK